jgi:hypothetical protein
MTTIYAVFLCATLNDPRWGAMNGQQQCQLAEPLTYKTENECEASRRDIERHPSPAINPGVKIVCMKKTAPTVPAWEPVH